MSARTPSAEPAILQALLLQASGSWRSLERLGNRSEEVENQLAAALLQALCISPMQQSECSEDSLLALAQLEGRAACAVALSRTLMAMAQEQLLVGESASARSSLRQALACSVNAVALSGITMPDHLADQLLSQTEQLAVTLASQLDLQLASRKRQLPTELVLVLGMHRSGTSALSGLLVQAGLDAPLDLMPATSVNPRGFWESLGAVELSDQLLQQLGCHWSRCWELPLNLWDKHADAFSAWRSGMLQLLRTTYPPGGIAVLKDPRLCILLPALQPWLESSLLTTTVFLPIRHPAEVAESLRIAQGIPRRQALLLWLGHVLHAERNSRQLNRLIVDYQNLLAEPQAVLSRSLEILKMAGSEKSLASSRGGEDAYLFIDPQLQRQHAKANEPEWVLEEQAKPWYDLALHVYTVMSRQKIKERKRRAQLDQIWHQWTTLTP